MSDRTRNLLALIMLVVLASSAFLAGYFTNDFVELQTGGTLVRNRTDFDIFWEAWDRIEESFIGDIPVSRDVAYGAIRGSMANLNDPYTVFIEPVVRQVERESLQGHFGGIGAMLSRPEEGGDIVLNPVPGNPAEAAGMLMGDVLIAVDDVEITSEITVMEVRDMLRGEKGTMVRLTVIHKGDEEPVELEIVRDDILDPSVTSQIVGDDSNVGYIRLARFSGESGGEVEDALNSLLEQGAETLILDLRNNGGGLLTAAVDVADNFLTDGAILYQVTKDEGEKEYLATNNTLVPDLPLVVLINGGTASASEIVAGALQDRERAALIGESQSYGKGSVQLVYDLSDGSSVHVTSARWYTPNRNQIDQQGLTPDVLVAVTQEAIDNGRDEVLNRAIEFLQNEE
jgi:carboxyl-terminal processing protease